MANPTSIVPVRRQKFNDPFVHWPVPVGSADTYYPGEMIGLRRSDGMAQHFDDTQSLIFLGIFPGPRKFITADLPQSACVLEKIEREYRISMPLASGTASRLTDLGKPVFAADSGHVQTNPKTLSFANLVGTISDVVPSDGNPWTMTGSSVWIEPLFWNQEHHPTPVFVAPATGGKTYGPEIINSVVLVPNTAAETLVLPAVANTQPGDTITFIKTNAAVFAVTIQGNGAENINGANTYATGTGNFATVTLISDGTQWIAMSVGKVV